MIFTAALVALPFVAQVFAKDCTRAYTVQGGDICDSISAARNVSTYQLLAINTGVINEDCTNLVPGSQICLGYTGEDCSTTYTVVSDDTCEGIAANNRLNSTVLFANNPQIDDDCSNIYVGEVLCVSDKVQVPPTPAGPLPGAAVPTTAAPANPTKFAEHSSKHPQAQPTQHSQPAQPHQDNDDDDDENLPYCDEL